MYKKKKKRQTDKKKTVDKKNKTDSQKEKTDRQIKGRQLIKIIEDNLSLLIYNHKKTKWMISMGIILE